jgi:riboflavin biosynthesis pyrimidine reductase
LIGDGGALVPAGVEQVALGGDSPIAPAAIIQALQERGLRRILIEGGPWTIARFLDAGCLDRLHVLIAPVIIGAGRSGLDLPPVAELALARRPCADIHLLGGGDVLYDCDLSAT